MAKSTKSMMFSICFALLLSHSSADEHSDCQGECSSQAFAHEDSRAQLSLLQTQFYVNPGPEYPQVGANSNYGFARTEAESAYNADAWSNGAPFVPPSAYNQNVQWSNGAPFVPPSAYNQNVQWSNGAPFVAAGAESMVGLQPTSMPAQPQILVDAKSASSTEMGGVGGLFTIVIVLLALAAVAAVVYMMLGGNPENQPKVARSISLKGMADAGNTLGSMLFDAGPHEHEHENDGHVHDAATTPAHELDADTYGMSVCSLIRDSYFMSEEGPSAPRLIRIGISIGLVIMTIALQIFLLAKVKEFITAKAVHDIREVYDSYEFALCGAHTYLTVNGKHRCVDGFTPPLADMNKALLTMSEDDQEALCSIPLSQPSFFGVVLFIWTLTCMLEMRKAVSLQMQITMLETVDDMGQSMHQADDGEGAHDGVINAMTAWMKMLLTVIMFVPRMLVTGYLLWVGCRWLLATTDFTDLLMNAIALEFILLIKEGLYHALTPARSHHDLTVTLMEPYPKKMTSTWWAFSNTVFLMIVAVGWVIFYMYYYQAVLPEYKWDVHNVCVDYLAERYKI